MLFLILAMALYIRVSLPLLRQLHLSGGEARQSEHGERVTQEIAMEALKTCLISFGEYAGTPAAQVEAARYVSRGAAGYILEGERRQVIGSGYEDEEEARQVCAMLREREGIEASVIVLDAPAVTLRITAGALQIEAFLRAQQLLRGTAVELLQLSFAVDRAEASAIQAGSVIQSRQVRLSEALRELRAQCGEQPHALFDGLTEIMDDMLAQLEKMRKETDAMALSSRLKYFYIDACVRQIGWMNAMVQG
jgi:hypothetical protein